jgi:hypothetical protein
MINEVKVKVIEVRYKRENNLFQMVVNKVESKEEVVLAIKGTDWGVTSKVPPEIIEKFCEEMKGKEKNLLIEEDDSDAFVKNVQRDEEGHIRQVDLDKIYNNLDSYPIDDIVNILDKETENED